MRYITDDPKWQKSVQFLNVQFLDDVMGDHLNTSHIDTALAAG